MSEILNAAFTMPTTIFSVLLILAGLYWLTVVLGMFDLELFDSLFDLAGGAAEGVLDGAAEGLAEGAAEGAAEGLADGADGAVEGEGGGGGLARGCLGALGVGQIPIAVPATLLAAFGWAFSYGGTELVKTLALVTVGGVGAVFLVGFSALALAFAATTVAVKPLKRIMRFEHATTRGDLVGLECTVTTQRVGEGFGQAEVVDAHGATILIQARSNEPDNGLHRGSRALIFNYDRGREVFYVSALGEQPIET